jgi:peptidoglycan/LPS O-acetylase OafA/YrhL
VTRNESADAWRPSARASRHELPGRAVLPYQPALDGVRAVAVLAVMAFHANLPWASGGFLGVDVFFVLSGFLITTLLVGEYAERGRIRLGHFWMRRALRLLPALVVLVVLLWWWNWNAFAPVFANTVRREAIFTLLYVANWAQIAGWLNPLGNFGHTWSLAIEEQFYILWPLVLSFLLGTLTRTGTMFAVGALAMASLFLRAALYDGHATLARVMHGSDTRAETLLIGCLLALLLRFRALELPPRPAFASALAVPGALALAWFFTSVTPQTEWLPRGGLTLVALSAAVLLLGLELSRESPLARALSWGPLVAIGRISYGLYLWHWPIFLILAPKDLSAPTASETALRFAATFAAATISWFAIERPALALKRRWS